MEGIGAEHRRERAIWKGKRSIGRGAHILSLGGDPVLGDVESKEGIIQPDDCLTLRSLHQGPSDVPAPASQIQNRFLWLVNNAGKRQSYQMAWLAEAEIEIIIVFPIVVKVEIQQRANRHLSPVIRQECCGPFPPTA